MILLWQTCRSESTLYLVSCNTKNCSLSLKLMRFRILLPISPLFHIPTHTQQHVNYSTIKPWLKLYHVIGRRKTQMCVGGLVMIWDYLNIFIFISRKNCLFWWHRLSLIENKNIKQTRELICLSWFNFTLKILLLLLLHENSIRHNFFAVNLLISDDNNEYQRQK